MVQISHFCWQKLKLHIKMTNMTGPSQGPAHKGIRHMKCDKTLTQALIFITESNPHEGVRLIKCDVWGKRMFINIIFAKANSLVCKKLSFRVWWCEYTASTKVAGWSWFWNKKWLSCHEMLCLTEAIAIVLFCYRAHLWSKIAQLLFQRDLSFKPQTGKKVVYICFIYFIHYILCLFKEPSPTFSIFFQTFGDFWYHKKAHIFLITHGKFHSMPFGRY